MTDRKKLKVLLFSMFVVDILCVGLAYILGKEVLGLTIFRGLWATGFILTWALAMATPLFWGADMMMEHDDEMEKLGLK